MKKAGRPSGYTKRKANRIIRHVAAGRTIRSIGWAGCPPPGTVHHWMRERPEFAQEIAFAREIGFEAFARQWLRRWHPAKDEAALARIIAREWAGTSNWGLLARWWPAAWKAVKKPRLAR